MRRTHLGLLDVLLTCGAALALVACSGSLLPSAAPAGRSIPGTAAQNSVLQYHKNATRDGLSIDPLLTLPSVGQMRAVPGFAAPLAGPVYAQPLFLDSGVGGKDALYVVTEQNQVLALDAFSGATLWQRTLGGPAPLSSFSCGNIDPLGITGTPVIDPVTQTLYLDAMMTSDGGVTDRHQVFALSTQDGQTRPGWPVDVQAALAAQGLVFSARDQNQRGALALLGDSLYIPYGGHDGDCGSYHGWVVGIKTADPGSVGAWSTRAPKGGVWAPGGIATDGAALYIGTGNTEGASVWSGGDALLRLPPSLAFSGLADDFYAPSDWQTLDNQDRDLGSAGPVLLDLPGQTPARLLLALGKNGVAYSLDRDHLGGITTAPSQLQAAAGAIISAPVAYTTPSGTYVAFKAVKPNCGAAPGTPDFMALKLGPSNQLSLGWCATQNGLGSPLVTSTDGTQAAVVWSLGAEGDGKLHAFDGQTGTELYASAGLGMIRRYQTPIEAKGRVYVATDAGIVAFQAGPK